MRLKVSPRQALTIIDALLREGWEGLRRLREKYDAELKRNPEFAKAMREDPIGVKVLSRSVPRCVSLKTVHEIELAFKEWSSGALTALELIYIDYVPIYTFTRAQPPSTIMVPNEDQKTAAMWNHHYKSWECQLDVIEKFYYDLRAFVRIPLMYLKEKAEIWFYDLCCPLALSSKEALFCEYMFEREYGESVEWDRIRLQKLDPTMEGSKESVRHAGEAVNTKTHETFGFSIFKIDRRNKLITLKPPTPLLRALFQDTAGWQK